MLIKQNHALLQRVLAVQETERKRISQDLHDELGQYLNAIKAQATSLLVDNTSSVDTLATAQRMIETADHGYHAARQMMHRLRPVALDELGLSAALEHLVNTWRNAQDSTNPHTDFQVNIMGNIDALDEQLNIGIFRIAQEALTNIAKHAKARHVVISMSYLNQQVTLNIQDDGIGFDTKKTANSFGLIGMVERAEALHGQLAINSDHQGTALTVTIHTQSQPNQSIK